MERVGRGPGSRYLACMSIRRLQVCTLYIDTLRTSLFFQTNNVFLHTFFFRTWLVNAMMRLGMRRNPMHTDYICSYNITYNSATNTATPIITTTRLSAWAWATTTSLYFPNFVNIYMFSGLQTKHSTLARSRVMKNSVWNIISQKYWYRFVFCFCWSILRKCAHLSFKFQTNKLSNKLDSLVRANFTKILETCFGNGQISLTLTLISTTLPS